MMLGHALALSAKGWKVFPLWWIEDDHCACPKWNDPNPEERCKGNNAGKHPIYKGTFDIASDDPFIISEWWKKHPKANIGGATGTPGGWDVVDMDPRNNGDIGFAEAEAKHGKLPATLVSNTGGGGKHYLLKACGKKLSKTIATGVDLKGIGGYIILPPSMHHSGRTYQWADGNPDEAAEWPEAWLAAAVKLEDGKRMPGPPVEGKINFNRNVAMASLAGVLRRKGLGVDETFPSVQAVNLARCNPPLDEAEVRTIVGHVCGYTPSERLLTASPTDAGNAMRLVERHGERLRYCPELGWLVWDGGRWCLDDVAAVMELAKDTARWVAMEAAAVEDGEKRKAMLKWASQSESLPRLNAMIELAKSDPGVVIRPNMLDADPWLLNCPNGTVDLRTGELRQHSQADLITKITATVYIPDAKSALWDDLLQKVMRGDKWDIYFLQQAAGYSLTGVTREQCLFIPWGKGNNGKTTFLEGMADVMGDYASHVAIEALLAKAHDSIPCDIAALKGARLVITGEVPEGRNMREATIKLLTGNDAVTARKLYHDPFTFVPEFKIWMGTNHKPIIRGTDKGIWRRIRLSDWRYSFDAPDKDFGRKLKETELPGILAWMVKGCLEWQKDGLVVPESVDKATMQYRAEMDVLGTFIEERCDVSQKIAQCAASALYAAYKEHCEANGEHPVNSRAFSTAMQERGYDKHRVDVGIFYTGITLSATESRYAP